MKKCPTYILLIVAFVLGSEYLELAKRIHRFDTPRNIVFKLVI